MSQTGRDSSPPVLRVLKYEYQSPAGLLHLNLRHGRVTAIDFVRTVSADKITPMKLLSPQAGRHPELPPDIPVRTALDNYFRAPATFDPDLYRLAAGGFTRMVLEAVQTIPPGRVLTYSELAAELGRPRAGRAVGNALAANPVPVLIPCHRVVAAGGLGGYKGGVEFKRFLLALEAAVCGPRPRPQ